jgi:hypothetical protein
MLVHLCIAARIADRRRARDTEINYACGSDRLGAPAIAKFLLIRNETPTRERRQGSMPNENIGKFTGDQCEGRPS